MPNFLKVPKNISVEWKGKEPLTLPEGKVLQPGVTTLPMALWHSLGGDPEMNAHIADGRLVAVHLVHDFADGDKHCTGCSMTRQQAETERAAKMPKKSTAPVETQKEKIP